MTRWSPPVLGLVLAIAALMVFPVAGASAPAPLHAAPLAGMSSAPAFVASPASVAGLHPSSAAPLTSVPRSVLGAIQARHIPLTDVFLPNYNARPSVSNGVVSPLYTAAPAPMGLGYFGVQQHGNHNIGTVSYTRSVEGAVTLNSVNPFYLASTSPDIFTMQLNTVLTHVTVLGNQSGQYWIQNVPLYFASTQTLGIEDNIWNFSAPGGNMQTTTLFSYNGTVVPNVFYFDVGPSWHMPMPFTIRLYNNASVVNNRPTVYFNYSITAANGSVITGSYDRVEFNSAVNPTSPAPMPSYQINGRQLNPIGLLNDAEIMLGGPGGGSTTTLLGISGSMGLWTLPNGTSNYKVVPAGSSFGTDTGETSEGIAEWTNGGGHPLAMLGPGPSLLQPLWGLVGAHSGFIRANVALSPSNAFIFASLGGSFHVNTAAWAPSPASGAVSLELTPATYTFEFLLSDHKPVTMTFSASTSAAVTLAPDANLGVYTPLYAWDNAQLPAISQPGGTGTTANPYVLDNNARGLLSPLFGEFNDFFYPVFTGVFLGNTNAHVSITGAPAFAVAYTLPVEAAFSAQFGTPASDNLGYQLFNASHVAIVGDSITGWSSVNVGFNAEVFLWNASDNLIAGNSFGVESTGIVAQGGTNNLVWGNVFSASTTTASNPGQILNPTDQNGIDVYESGDVIFNNAFLVPVPAVTPPFNLYTGAPQLFQDKWNVMMQPASNVRMFDGWTLTGSILGLSYLGGNYWSNYGSAQDPFGVLPYNDGGAIILGGDFVPLTPSPIYQVVFTEHNLPAGTAWSVTLNGITVSSTGTTVTFWDPNGTYAFTVPMAGGLTAHPSIGAVSVAGATVLQGIRFS